MALPERVIAILAERENRTEWAKRISDRSRLFWAHTSLLQTYPDYEVVLSPLIATDVYPDDLIPATFWEAAPEFDTLGWNRRTDGVFNIAEEAGDFMYQVVKLSIADEMTVRRLVTARRSGDREGERSVLKDRMASPQVRRLFDEWLSGDDQLTLIDQFLAQMDSRKIRGANPIVQPALHIWKKLISSGPNRIGEYTELLDGARIVDIEGTGQLIGKSDLLSDVYSLGVLLDKITQETGILYYPLSEHTTNTFYRLLPQLVERWKGIFVGTPLSSDAIIQFALRKQELRIEIGKRVADLETEAIVLDRRAGPKVITQLFLPYLVAPLLPAEIRR